MDRLKSIFELREMLRLMESNVGLGKLSRAECDILLVAHTLSAESGDSVTSDDIRGHEFIKSIAQATYHRALKTLLEGGFLEMAAGSITKQYVVRRDLVGH